jgi:type III secretion system (T3SS) inner membrane Yop/YscD-like protein
VAVQLRVLSGKSAGEAFELQAGSSYLLGTRKANDFRLRDKGVGFKHAKITVDEAGQVQVEDLGAKGGTTVGSEALSKNEPQLVQIGQAVRFGTIELVLEVPAADSDATPEPQPEPVAEAKPEPEPEPVVEAKPEPEPEPVVEAKPEPEPEPVVEPSAPAEPLPALTPKDQLPDDLDLLKERYRDLERRLIEKTQEARAYEEALENASGGGGAGAYDDGLGDGLGGLSDSVSGDLEARVLELQLAADEQAAAVLEKDEELKILNRELAVLRERQEESRDRTERERQSIAEDILRGHERLEERKSEAATARAEVAEFEEVNAELLLETEELKEKLAAVEYLLEQERAERGQLVRQRLVDLRTEAERLEAANAELRTLVEAYEEKIDELDERVEEFEGESEAHDSLVVDLRQRLTKVEQERDVMVKTLRKKLQGLERKLERLQAENARARAASEAGS